MRLHISEEHKFAELWLTNEDQHNEAVLARLPQYYRDCKAKGYQAVVFYSGQGDLYEHTAALLLRNRDTAAEQEVQRRKTRAKSSAMTT